MRNRILAHLLVAVVAVTIGCESDGPSEPASITGDAQVQLGPVPGAELGDIDLTTTASGPHGRRRHVNAVLALRIGVIDPLQDDRASGTWHQVEFDRPFHPSARVIVLPAVQTYTGAEPPGLRIRNVTNTGFEIRMDEIDFAVPGGRISSDGRHLDEVLGWVAYGFRGVIDTAPSR